MTEEKKKEKINKITKKYLAKLEDIKLEYYKKIAEIIDNKNLKKIRKN